MHLKVRTTNEGDLTKCAKILPEEIFGAIRANMIDAWRYLLLRGALISAVVEDHDRALEDRILAAGMTYIVTQEFMEEVRKSRRPTLGHVLVDALTNGRCPALDRAGVRNANSSVGLNLAFQGILKPGIEADEQFGMVLDRLTRAFFEFKAGYKIKQAVTEAIGEQELQLHYAVGGRALDVQPILNADPALPSSLPSFRIWLHREAALNDPGSQFCRLFLYSPPRFFFSEKEQVLLQQAMQGMTDEELASTLGVSLSTVKKRWQSVYAHVADEAPELFPPGAGASEAHGKRGVEKKQRLIEYVRVHAEELRPNKKSGV